MDYALNLLKGSRAIDQMRQDIHDFVQMVSGLIRVYATHGSSAVVIKERFGDSECYWKVDASVGNRNRDLDYVKVECWTRMGGIVLASPKVNDYRFRPSEVLVVHQNLNTLIQGLRAKLPQSFESELSPFYKAADLATELTGTM